MDERLAHHLLQMRRAAVDACAFVEGLERADFLADRRTQQAVTMSLLVIGEAATRIVDGFSGFVADHADVPWKAMRGMRNRIAHGYFEIDQDIVWDTVQSALPQLVQQLESIAPSQAE